MKTSNKIIVAIVLLLATAAIVNALTLKGRFETLRTRTPAGLVEFPAADFHSIELSGAAPQGIQRLHVNIRQSDRFHVSHSAVDFIHIVQEGDVLKITVDHSKSNDTGVKRAPEIMIECPELTAMTAMGTALDQLGLPDANLATQRFYQKSHVTITGFHSGNMRVVAVEGMDVRAIHLTVDTLTARADQGGTITIGNNELRHATLTIGDDATISLDHTQIGTVATDVAEKGQFIVKGTHLTAHGTRSND